MSHDEREILVYLAKVDEQAERYDEMVDHMKQAAAINPDLTIEERNLLSVAYKNIIGQLRASWRVISSIEQKEKEKGTEGPKLERIKQYREKVTEELVKECNDIIKLLDQKLIPVANAAAESEAPSKAEAKVFFFKMKGDYYRYLVEVQEGSHRQESTDNSLQAYQHARDIAITKLLPTNPICLGLALNFSVFYYEILKEPRSACDLAKMAFDDAIAKIDSLSDDCYKDSTLIMQLLQDNLTLWTSDLPCDENDVEDVENL